MELTVSEKQTISNLPAIESHYVNLRVGHPLCGSMGDYELKKQCLILITRSFTYSTPNGQTSEDILSFQSNELFIAIRKDFKDLTMLEVQDAFKDGLNGLFGAWYGMCGKTYHQFLKGFKDRPERSKSWLAYLELLSVPKSDKPVVFTKEYLTKVANSALEDYKRDGSMPIIPHAIYDTIKEVKGLETLILKEDWNFIKAEAKESYERKMNPKKKKSVAELLDYGITYEFEVKRVALKYYFERSKNESN